VPVVQADTAASNGAEISCATVFLLLLTTSKQNPSRWMKKLRQ